MGQFNFMKMFQSHLLSLCRAYLDLHLPVSVPDPDHSDVSRRHEEAGLLLPVHHHACTYNTVAGLECSNQHVTKYAHQCEKQHSSNHNQHFTQQLPEEDMLQLPALICDFLTLTKSFSSNMTSAGAAPMNLALSAHSGQDESNATWARK